MRGLDMVHQLYRAADGKKIAVDRRDDNRYVVDLSGNERSTFQCDDKGCSMTDSGVPEHWDTLYYELMKRDYKSRSTTGNDFIHCPDSLSEIKFKEKPSYGIPQTWEEIVGCTEEKIGPFLIKSTCKPDPNKQPKKVLTAQEQLMSEHKVFVCGLTNLYDYGRALRDGLYTKRDHETLGKILQMNSKKLKPPGPDGYKVINHNEEVDILHFKFEIDKNSSPRRLLTGDI